MSTSALELIRDRFDRTGAGIILTGVPGMEKRLSRYPQLYSRVGFAPHYRGLQGDELSFVLTRRFHRLFVQIGRILNINGLSVSIDDGVAAARSTLVIGVTYTAK